MSNEQIRDLEDKIAHRNNEIAMLLSTLDETVQVKEHLLHFSGKHIFMLKSREKIQRELFFTLYM